MSRDHILHKVRTALGRTAGQAPEPPPPVRIAVPEVPLEARIASLREKVEALSGRTFLATSRTGLLEYVSGVIQGRRAVASNAPFLAECGIPSLPGVECGIFDRDRLRQACSEAAVGITSADYALADTGTLVLLASRAEARLISLLPPVHLAVVPRSRILTGLDELLSLEPLLVASRSSAVFITGPSRTGDIEQFLVRGVHGPGEIHVAIA